MTSAPQLLRPSSSHEFTFSGRHRTFEAVEAVPLRWPTTSPLASEYINDWRDLAAEILGAFKLSRKTAFCIASHISRRDGFCRLTDKALASRSGRSFCSTKRDVHRLKLLGLLIAEYEAGEGSPRRVRVLKIALPGARMESPRIPRPEQGEAVSTYPTYVEPLDIGERRDV